MNIAHMATQMGAFIGGIANLAAIATAFYEFRRYRKQRRSEAAIRAYSAVQACLDYINEIANRSDLYEIKEYYPFQMPEVKIAPTEKYHERPAQLIINRIYECKRDLYESIAIIAGAERKELLKLVDQMQNAASTLLDDLYMPPEKNTNIPKTYSHIEKIQTDVKMISKHIFTLLTPIIEGKN